MMIGGGIIVTEVVGDCFVTWNNCADLLFARGRVGGGGGRTILVRNTVVVVMVKIFMIDIITRRRRRCHGTS